VLRMACIAASAALLFSADVPQVSRVVTPAPSRGAIPSNLSVPLFWDLPSTSGDSSSPSSGSSASNPSASGGSSANQPTVPDQDQSKSPGTLQEESRMQILRYVDGEFARMVAPLPGSKKGFHAKVGEPLDQAALRKAIRSSGAALNAGDSVQITKLDFLPRGILVELNGGGNSHRNWRDHLQLSLGVPTPLSTSTTTTDNRPPQATQKSGATFYLDFNRSLPDMSPDQVKKYLTVIMDFSKQRSAAIQWTDSLPPQIQEAIRDKRAVVGMDREMVMAAMGRPDRKVRERDPVGNDIEDWIYGHPPSPTTFVRFLGEKVSQIDQYQ
jgi:hypothetical protein